jgi:hypothetical protein
MQLRFALGVLALGVVAAAACAGQVVDGDQGPVGEGGLAATGEGGAGDGAATGTGSSSGGTSEDSGKPAGPIDGGHIGFEDSGAVIVGTEDAGTPPDSGSGDSSTLPAGTCNVLADCPYQNATEVAGVACTDHVCVITCNGDNYDVNGVLSDGCEVPNPCPTNAPGGSSTQTQHCPLGHQQASATDLGSFSCDDTSSAQNVLAFVPSDDRAHSPAVVAFDGTAGAAPVVLHLYGSGGICDDDLNLDLQMKTPSTRFQCYSLVAVTNKGTYTCAQTDATGLCQISNSSGSYGDNSDIYITIAKLDSCPATETDDGAFNLTGHM